MKQALLIVFGCLFVSAITFAQDSAFLAKTLIHRGDTLPYRILYPADYNPEGSYPVLFFLHGAGERGNDNEKQLVHGAKLFLEDRVRNAFPAIVVFAQCPEASYWSNVDIQSTPAGRREFYFRTKGKPSTAMSLFLRLVTQIRKQETVDKQRLYIGGLSMGAMGTFEALRRKPRFFAAAFAICGGDNTANVKKYAHVPLWIFHGEQDNVVPPTHSHAIVNELRRLGARPKATFYPTANHNSWDNAFAEPGLLPWLFGHTNKK